MFHFNENLVLPKKKFGTTGFQSVNCTGKMPVLPAKWKL